MSSGRHETKGRLQQTVCTERKEECGGEDVWCKANVHL